MIEGLFVKLENYAPKILIKLAVWSILLVLISEGLYAIYDIWVWLITPLAKEGFIGEEYAETQRLLSISTDLFTLIAFTIMLPSLVILKWRLYKYKKEDPFPDDASLKEFYLSMFKHAEDYHPEIWDEIIDELKKKQNRKNN